MDFIKNSKSNLFHQGQLQEKVAKHILPKEIATIADEIFNRWQNEVDLSKETENQQSFLTKIISLK